MLGHAPLSKLPVSTLDAAPLDDSDDSWWSGSQLGFASIPIAGAAAALSLSVSIASSFQQNDELVPHVDEEYSWQVPLRQPVPIFQVFAADDEIPALTLYGFERWDVLAVGDPPQPFAFTADDELAQPAPTPDEAYHWQARWLVPALQLSGPVWDDAVPARLVEEEYSWTQPYSLRLSLGVQPAVDEEVVPQQQVPDEIYSWQAPGKIALPDARVFGADDELPPTPTLSGQESWDLLSVGDLPQGYAFVSDDEIVPPAAPLSVDEQYWLSFEPQPRPVYVSIFWADAAVATPPALLGGEDSYSYTAPRPAALAITVFSEDDETVPQPQLTVDDAYSLIAPASTPVSVTIFSEDDEVPPPSAQTLSGHEAWDVVPVGDLPQGYAFATDDEIVPQPVFHPEEDYWWSAAPKVVSPPSWAFSADDEIEIPAAPTLSGHEVWQVLPVGDVPLGYAVTADDEIVPQAAPLHADEDYWLNLRSYQAPLDLRVFSADDEITQLVLSESVGTSSFPQRKRHSPVIKLWEFTEELPPTPTLGGFEDWQVVPIGDPPQGYAFVADDEGITFIAPPVVVEPPKGGRHKKGRLAYVPDKPIPQVVPRAVFTADVESHLEFGVELRVSVQVVATCSADIVATHAAGLLAVAAFDGSAELELDRTSEVGPLVGSGSSSADHDVVGLVVGRSTARAELTSDPKNKRPLSDGEILAALEALSKLPKKRPPV